MNKIIFHQHIGAVNLNYLIRMSIDFIFISIYQSFTGIYVLGYNDYTNEQYPICATIRSSDLSYLIRRATHIARNLQRTD